MNKDWIVRILTRFGLKNAISEETADYLAIKVDKGNILIEVFFPFNRFEAHFDAIDIISRQKLTDGIECYGETQRQDFKSEVEHILTVLNQYSLRITQDSKTAEYNDGEWQYFFGRFNKAYLAHEDDAWRDVAVAFSGVKAQVSHRGYPVRELLFPTGGIDTGTTREGDNYLPASYSAEDVLKWHNTKFTKW